MQIARQGAGLRAMFHRLLIKPTMPLWQHCLWLFVVAYVPSAFVLLGAYWVLRTAGFANALTAVSHRSITIEAVLGGVILAPIVETVLLAGVLTVLQAWIKSPTRAAIASGVLWGVVHGIISPIRFLGSVWAFIVFSLAYIAWRKVSVPRGLVAAAVPHVLGNATTYLLLWSLT